MGWGRLEKTEQEEEREIISELAPNVYPDEGQGGAEQWWSRERGTVKLEAMNQGEERKDLQGTHTRGGGSTQQGEKEVGNCSTGT